MVPLINDKCENNFDDIYSHVMILISRRRMMILVKPRFWTFSIDVHDRRFTLSCLIKRYVFPFNINCMPSLDSYIPSKIFCTSIGCEILHVSRTVRSLINMVTHVDLLLMWMKKQSSECTHIISVLKMIFGKHFKVFHICRCS